MAVSALLFHCSKCDARQCRVQDYKVADVIGLRVIQSTVRTHELHLDKGYIAVERELIRRLGVYASNDIENRTRILLSRRHENMVVHDKSLPIIHRSPELCM